MRVFIVFESNDKVSWLSLYFFRLVIVIVFMLYFGLLEKKKIKFNVDK